MRHFPATPREMFASLWRNRQLILALTKREVLGRYRGSVIGFLWSFINPLLLLSVYTFVFSEVFKARWNLGSDSKVEFALVLFAGLIVFNLFAECVSRAPSLIITNANYVKKVVFPLEILPIVSLLSALYHGLINVIVWLLAFLALVGIPHPTVLLLILVLPPLAMFIMGLSWMLSSLGVYLRDISQFIGFLVLVLMFMTPVFYPVSALPEVYRRFSYLNPLTPIIELTRDVLYWGSLPNFSELATYWLFAGISAWLGFIWFQLTREGFADVI